MPYPPRYPQSQRPTKEKPDASAFLSNAVTRIGQIVALLAGLAIAAILVDQGRHFFSDSHTSKQRVKHGFMCYQHSRIVSLPDNANHLEERRALVEQRVYLMMDVVRQQNAPTEFLGKLRQFSLCSSFSKAGLGGFEVSGTKETQQSVVLIDQNTAAEMIGRVNFLASQYPDFPQEASSELKCQLRILVEFEANPFAYCEDAIYTLPRLSPASVVVEPSDPTDAVKEEEKWLLVVGADQTDAAAADQVRITQEILAGNDAGLAQAGSVELRLIRSWRRTVVAFDTEEDAATALQRLSRVLPYGAYVRVQSKWCPDLAETDPIEGIKTMICDSG